MNSKIILTLFIAFIMITSVIGFIWSSSPSEDSSNVLDYNNYEFRNVNGRYLLELNNHEYVFDNSPYEVSSVDFEDFNLESDKYYILFNPDEKDLNMEYSIQKLYLVLNSLGINVQLACSIEEGCDESLPIKNCDDHSFYFKKMSGAKVYKNNNCIVIEGDNDGISKAVDKIDMDLLNI
jgi:hypothetical protein